MKGFLIAGTASGVGKTTVALALIAALRRRGLVVQPFKSGPDFLDTGHLARIAGRTARNLDTWMLSTPANLDVFSEACAGADFAIAEGMMGLFDGKDGNSERGSSAEIAKLLQLPVILVLDAAKSARSIAAVVMGFEQFDPELKLAGVILNRAAGERHYRMLEVAIAAHCRTAVLGWLPRDARVSIAERHLGLTSVEEYSPAGLQQQTDTLAQLAEDHLRLDVLAALECGFALPTPKLPRHPAGKPVVRIGVARDAAFSFYYEDNLDLLRQHGAEIVPFSPLNDAALPAALDALYLGGGYPELHAERLGGNASMLASLRDFAASGRPIYAECGGMIFLSRQLTTRDGACWRMADLLPLSIEMTGKLDRFGYVTVTLTRDCLLGPAGAVMRGHSFHYSRIAQDPDLPASYRVDYSLSARSEPEGFTLGNILASYVHLHFRTAPHIAQSFVHHARTARTEAYIAG